MNEDLAYLLSLHSVDGLGSVRLARLLDYFGTAENAWKASLSEFKGLSVPENVLQNLAKKRKELDPEKYYLEIKSSGINIKTIFEKDYPYLLKQIPDHPLLFFYFGSLGNLNNPIAVVGTRKVTGYGRSVTEKFVSELVETGCTIVSGLARGVDTVAHQQTLKSNGITLAILGGGLKKIFPPENDRLAKEIAESGGAVISEFPIDYPSTPGNFPARNRIIAGLSIATLVTEAAEDSGSLITARLALEYNREVFAVPGPITSSLSLGPASLIKEGAKLVTSAEEITLELGLDRVQSVEFRVKNLEGLSEEESSVLELLVNEGRHIDEICRQLQKTSSIVSATLIKMEIKGIIKNVGGGNYIRSL